ncbi:MAG: lysophospholipid acyltransferase family protein [Bacilli bacterium]
MFLEILMLICGAGLATCGSLSFWPMHNWYDFYIPILLFFGGYFAGLTLIWIFIWLVGTGVNEKKEYHSISKWVRWWMINGIDYIVDHALIHTTVINRRKMPKKERFLLVCNHTSVFDSLIITQKFGLRDIAFITKKDNMHLPLANKLMWRLCYLPIDREDYLQSLDVMKKATALAHDNVTSIGVFPEGTRSADGHIANFHEGVFNIAIKGKLPIVIVTLKNTYDIHRHLPFRFTHVYLDVVGVIPYEEFEDMPAKKVSDMVHDIMLENLTKQPS